MEEERGRQAGFYNGSLLPGGKGVEGSSRRAGGLRRAGKKRAAGLAGRGHDASSRRGQGWASWESAGGAASKGSATGEDVEWERVDWERSEKKQGGQ